MRRGVPIGLGGVVLALLLIAWGDLPCRAAEEPKPDPAVQALDSARRAYNEGRYDFSAARFREFLAQHGGHKDAPAAQYGLALSLLGLPQPDYPAAIQALQQVAGRRDFPDRAWVCSYLGSAQRALGGQALEQAAAKPNEAANFRNTANGHFGEALKNFTAAADAFAERLKNPPPAPAAGQPAVPAPAVPGEPPELEWLARSRCDQCEMLLRLEKPKEAAELAQSLLADKAMEKSRYRELALYHLGFAQFSLKDYPAAGKTLSQLAPFAQEFGVHARYLLARVHHLAGERPEAAAQYKALLADFQQQSKMAQEAMRNPGALRQDERARAEAVLKAPPEHVLRAMFYTALLLAEEGKVNEALEGFNTLLQKYPKCSVAEEAQLRQGYCHMQMRSAAETVKSLQPLHNHPQLGDRALWWTARSQIAAADPSNAQAHEQALRGASDLLNRAAERAGQLAANDPEAKVRRGDILLDLGDAQQMIKQHREAAATYQKALAENNNPERAEDALQRQATALHLAGQYKESDDVCARFEQTYPKSPLLSAVWFRAAENTGLTAIAALNDPNFRNRRPDVDRMFDEAINRYQRLLKKFPEFPYANLARYGLATAQYQRGQFAEAEATLAAIGEPDRTGDLAAVSYLMADCLLRQFPAETEDALAAGQLVDQAQEAAKLLEKYVMAAPKGPQMADAVFKLGYCYRRIGAVTADAAQRQKVLGQAKQAYDRVLQESPGTPAYASAALERAGCMVLLGDVNGATSELGRFQSDPLKNSPVAPLALIRLAALLRAQNRAADAVKAMAQCSQYEGNLKSDPDRGGWVAMIRYEHALAVKDSGKLADARGMFEAVAREFAGRPEAAQALWRAGQCRREEFMAVLATSKATLAKAGVQPQESAGAVKAIEEGLTGLRQTAESFKAEARKLAPGAAGEGYPRVLYETAWCYRVLAEAEVEAARQKLRLEARDKVLAAMKKANLPAPLLNPPEVPLASVPQQPSEKAAREQYAAVIAAAKDKPLAARARFELAEMVAQRGENDAALDHLAAALESNPTQEFAERIRLRIAACLLAKKELKGALAQAQTVAKNATSPLAAEARYLAGEIYIENKDWAAAIEQLKPFRDQDPFRNAAGLVDRALLRLGCALAESKQWDQSRQAYEAVVQRFPQSPWVYEARYGIGWAWQNQNQHDNAAGAFAEVTRGTAAEVAARSQFQLGLCRLAQKRYPDAAKELLAVAYAYEYPELTAMALCEAGQAYLEMKQPKEASGVLQRVIQEHGATRWAETARQRLSTIK